MISDIAVIVLCCFLPYILIMLSVAIPTVRARFKSAFKDFENIKKKSQYDNESTYSISWKTLVLYITISYFALGALLCVLVAVGVYYLEFPSFADVNFKTLGFISVLVLLAALIISLTLFIIYIRIFKDE